MSPTIECTPRRTPYARYGDEFVQFHNRNTHVYKALVMVTEDWIKRTGKTKCGMTLIIATARWEYDIITDGKEFRLNDAFQPYYARLIMIRKPHLNGVFDLRKTEVDAFMMANLDRLH